ncbi:hypothetical protein R3P38DRAFT_3536576 [Favolaschia claudopus]|uniref:Uncharacterized protein n=1 Tax=Favolaschia claudopus TaxID=2862362 RepID=A0AAW0BA37_9AGAR
MPRRLHRHPMDVIAPQSSAMDTGDDFDEDDDMQEDPGSNSDCSEEQSEEDDEDDIEYNHIIQPDWKDAKPAIARELRGSFTISSDDLFIHLNGAGELIWGQLASVLSGLETTLKHDFPSTQDQALPGGTILRQDYTHRVPAKIAVLFGATRTIPRILVILLFHLRKLEALSCKLRTHKVSSVFSVGGSWRLEVEEDQHQCWRCCASRPPDK